MSQLQRFGNAFMASSAGRLLASRAGYGVAALAVAAGAIAAWRVIESDAVKDRPNHEKAFIGVGAYAGGVLGSTATVLALNQLYVAIRR